MTEGSLHANPLPRVDNAVRLVYAMPVHHVRAFIMKKCVSNPNDVVQETDGGPETLSQMFERLQLDPTKLSHRSLGVFRNGEMLNCLDFDFAEVEGLSRVLTTIPSALRPGGGQGRQGHGVRKVFLDHRNLRGGDYLAEMAREFFFKMKWNGDFAEIRIDIFGVSRTEWTDLADWAQTHDVHCANVRWCIQLRAVYAVYRKRTPQIVHTLSEMLDNIFEPLMEVTKHPLLQGQPERNQRPGRLWGAHCLDPDSVPKLCTSSVQLYDMGGWRTVWPGHWTGTEGATVGNAVLRNVACIAHSSPAPPPLPRGVGELAPLPHSATELQKRGCKADGQGRPSKEDLARASVHPPQPPTEVGHRGAIPMGALHAMYAWQYSGSTTSP